MERLKSVFWVVHFWELFLNSKKKINKKQFRIIFPVCSYGNDVKSTEKVLPRILLVGKNSFYSQRHSGHVKELKLIIIEWTCILTLRKLRGVRFCSCEGR